MEYCPFLYGSNQELSVTHCHSIQASNQGSRPRHLLKIRQWTVTAGSGVKRLSYNCLMLSNLQFHLRIESFVNNWVPAPLQHLWLIHSTNLLPMGHRLSLLHRSIICMACSGIYQKVYHWIQDHPTTKVLALMLKQLLKKVSGIRSIRIWKWIFRHTKRREVLELHWDYLSEENVGTAWFGWWKMRSNQWQMTATVSFIRYISTTYITQFYYNFSGPLRWHT